MKVEAFFGEVRYGNSINYYIAEKTNMSSNKILLKVCFGVDLPIKGGDGNSIDNAVIIEKQEINDYVSVEYAYLKYFSALRGVTWKKLEQSLLNHEGRKIDKVKIETVKLTENEVITQKENYYFDITDCY